MDAHPGHVIPSNFDLAGVNSSSHLDVEGSQSLTDSQGTFDSSAGTVERGHDTIPHGLHHPTPKAFDLGAHALVVAVEQVPPPLVTKLCGTVGRTHDVGEQHRGENPLSAGTATDACQKLLNLVEHRSRISDPVERVGPRHLDVHGFWNVIGEVATMLHANE